MTSIRSGDTDTTSAHVPAPELPTTAPAGLLPLVFGPGPSMDYIPSIHNGQATQNQSFWGNEVDDMFMDDFFGVDDFSGQDINGSGQTNQLMQNQTGYPETSGYRYDANGMEHVHPSQPAIQSVSGSTMYPMNGQMISGGMQNNIDTRHNPSASVHQLSGNSSSELVTAAAREAAERVAKSSGNNSGKMSAPSSNNATHTGSKRSALHSDTTLSGQGRSTRRRTTNDADEKAARSRERNRIHARKSRLRKKFFLDSLRNNLEALEQENARMKEFIKQNTGKSYEELAKAAADGDSNNILAGPSRQATKQIEHFDFKLMQALTMGQQNFVVTDPSLPDNPIVFASQGFYKLTGYEPSEVVGRNCRFLQGPETDPRTVAVIREGVEKGRDTAVCLINYKKDGTAFWNQFFVAPLRGVDGKIVNFVGVQCEVSEQIAQASIESGKKSGLYDNINNDSESTDTADKVKKQKLSGASKASEQKDSNASEETVNP